MDFVCLDGTIATVELKPSKWPAKKISSLQTAARERIKQEFGDQIILEEFLIPKTQLRLDFFLPKINIVIEVHGRQHFKFVKHFHGTQKKFVESQQRDNFKIKWCELNDIQLFVWIGDDNESKPA